MNTKKNLLPALATHPGEIIQDELDARGVNQAEFAKLIGIEKTQLNEIIKGKRNINADLALLLEKAIEIDADYWMSAQKNYELDQARINEKNQSRLEAIEEWSIWSKNIPGNFFKKHKFLSGDPVQDIGIVKAIYGVSHVDQIASTYASPAYARYKKTNTDKVDRNNVVAWTKLISYLGEQQKVGTFHRKHRDSVLEQLKSLITENKNVKERAITILAEAGIKLIYHKNAEKCPIDGVCLWSGKNPLIGMSLRHNRLDNFAFTLFHELGHVYLHLVNNPEAQFLDDLDHSTNSINEEETEANEFAANSLISSKDWATFIGNKNRMLDEYAISFGKEIGIHPIIIKGRIKHHFNDYTLRTKIANDIK
jgi:HTH-type transcriptional regulator / antitoxin HigA